MADQLVLPRVRTLTATECLRLLATCALGRVGLREPVGPLVVPVTYVLDGGVLVFRTDDGARLRGVDRQPVTFEVDGFDALQGTAWSVFVCGRAEDASYDEVRRLGLRPCAAGGTKHWVRLVPVVVTGCRAPSEEVPQ